MLDQVWCKDVMLWHKNSRVALVRPCSASDDRQKLFQKFYRCLSLQDIIVKIIDYAEILLAPGIATDSLERSLMIRLRMNTIWR